MLQVLNVLDTLRVLAVGGQADPGELQHIVLTKADGTVFVDSAGNAIVRGYQFITPQE